MLAPVLPKPGINKDDSTFAAEGRWADGDGFRFVGGYPETIGGAVKMSSATAVLRANKLLTVDVSGTTKLVVAGDTLLVAAMDAAGTDITPAAGWTANKRHCLAMWGDTLLATVGGGKLYESNLAAQATEIANAPDEITAMLVTPSRQVMVGGCNEESSGTFNGRCIRWSDIEDNTVWTTLATNNAGEYILPGQADIVAMCLLGDYVVIWTEAAMWLAQFTGDPADTFTFTRVGDIGICGLDAHTVYSQTVFFVGSDLSYYAYQLGGQPQRLHCPMQATHPVASTPTSAATAFACAVRARGEIWFGICPASTQPDRYMVYCADESARAQASVWFTGTFTNTAISTDGMSAGAMIDSHLQWDNGTYGTAVIVHGFTGNALDYRFPFRWDCKLNTKGISGSYIQSADTYIDNSQRRMMVRGIVYDFDEQGGNVSLTLFTKDRPGAATTTKGPYTLTARPTGYLVNDVVVSGDTDVTIDTGSGGIAAGRQVTFAGVNAWADGADTGSLARFTVASDYAGGNGTLALSEAIVSTGGSRNVVALPANNAAITVLGPNGKKDFRASGKLIAIKFATSTNVRARLGKPLFDVVPMGER